MHDNVDRNTEQFTFFLLQFNTVMMLIREMLNKVEEDHQSKLQQLDSIKVQQDSFFQSGENNKPISTDPFNFDAVSTTLPKNGDGTAVLSLDDKERLAFQKEQQQRLNNEQPLVPQTKPSLMANTKSSSQAKDLTSTLISANLNMLPRNQSFTSSSNSMSFANFNSQPIANRPASEHQLANSGSSKPNMSAFDSLIIPNLSQKATGQSLNAMKTDNFTSASSMNANSSLSFPIMNNVSNNQSSSSSKQLSKSELEEFLN